MAGDVLTFTDAAAVLKTDVRTVRGLVELLGIVTKPVPRNGNARGLDARDMKAIREAIRAGRVLARSA
jgi:hypothetical protein